MAEGWDAADDDLEKLLDFDDLEVPTISKSCKTLPTVDTKVVGPKGAGELPRLNSSDPHAIANTEIAHDHATLPFGAGRDVDEDDSSAIASVSGTVSIASRADRFIASTDSVRSRTSQLSTQVVLSRSNGLDHEYFSERNGVRSGVGHADTQKFQLASGREKHVVSPTNGGHGEREFLLTAENSAKVQAYVGIDDVGLDHITVRAADHTLQERSSLQSTSIRGSQKGCSSLHVDRENVAAEIGPGASVGVGVNVSDKSSDKFMFQTRQSMPSAQTQGPGRVGSQFIETRITASLQKKLNSSKNVARTVENTQALPHEELPETSQCNPRNGNGGAHHKRTEQQEAEFPETGINGGLPYRIPGPAGALQQNFRKRTSNGTLKSRRRSFEAGSQSDSNDFVEGSWISAMDYVNGGASEHLPKVTICTIKSLSRNLEHIPELVAVIKSVVPNGFGDVSIVLKDPTGTINGCIHRSVLTESKYGQGVVPGAVLILRKATVFSPNPYAHYLNITTENVHKVFGSEVGKSRPQPRVPTDKTINVEDLAGIITQRIREPTGARNSMEHSKLQPVIRHDAGHVNTDNENQTSVEKPTCVASAKSLPNPILATTLQDRKDIESQGGNRNLGIRRDSSKNPSQVLLPEAKDAHEEDASREAVVAAKAKAAGWDFGEDVELLLNDDMGNFLL